MRTSYSSLDTYKKCPLKFKYQELDRIKVPKLIEAIYGAIIHDCLKFIFERNPLYPTIDETVNFFTDKWEEKKDLFKNSDEEKIYYEDGISILKKFYKTNPPWNFNTVDLESRFEVELEDPEKKQKHTLVGIIDRIDKNPEDESYEIIDYKTARKMPSQDILDNNLQMSIYHLGLIKRWPHLSFRNIKITLYFLKHGEKISTFRSEEKLEDTKKFVLDTINEIEKKIKNNYEFPPVPSPLCGWCGYKKMCPMWKHLYNHQSLIISNQKDIEPIIKEYFELKAQNEKNNDRLNELKTVIYGFMDNEKVDRVFGSEGYLTRKIQERVSYDMKKIKDILKEKISDFITKKQFTTLVASKKKMKKEK